MSTPASRTNDGTDEDYVTPKELAKHLRVSLSTIYTAIHDGELAPVLRAGKRGFRIPIESRDRYIAGLVVGGVQS